MKLTLGYHRFRNGTSTDRDVSLRLVGLNVIDTSLISETALHNSQTRIRPTSSHIGWRVKENFPETFKTQLEKNRNVIHRPGSVRIVRNSVPSV